MGPGHEPGRTGAVSIIAEEVSPNGRSPSEYFTHTRMGAQIRTFGCPKFHLSITRIKQCPFFGVLINNEFLLGRECLHGTVLQKLSGPLRIGQRNAKTWKGEVIAWEPGVHVSHLSFFAVGWEGQSWGTRLGKRETNEKDLPN